MTDQMNELQSLAYWKFREFIDDPEEVLFGLFGAAGTGKSYTSGKLLELMRGAMDPFDEMLWLAPTWKAVRVAGSFLDANDFAGQYEVGYDYYHHSQGRLVLTTTQQALGIRPNVKEDQKEDNLGFAESGNNLLRKLKPRFVAIDEVSMLSWTHLKRLTALCAEYGTKLLIIGDPKQLPPVKAEEIKWDKLRNTVELTEIMRQSSDSAIPYFASLVQEGGDWDGMTGTGLTKMANVPREFVRQAIVPSEVEEEWTVFVAYRNKTVDRVQEAVCQQVYGHSKEDFMEGQVVIAQQALHNRSGMLIANQDRLTVLDRGEQGRWGREVSVRNLAGRTVHTEYVSGSDLQNQGHPWNIELTRLKREALYLQAEYKKGNKMVDGERRKAWSAFFEHKDKSILQFAHPFAITSHKSQGSTYGRVFIAAQEIFDFSPRGLYVAATRPREELIY